MPHGCCIPWGKHKGAFLEANMAKFRKKPVVIDAVQFEDTAECLIELDAMGLGVVCDYADKDNPVLRVGTLKGVMIANPGDWIIKGIKGEFCPCKPDIFEATYEAVPSFKLGEGPDML